MYLVSADFHNKEQVKAISEVANVNLLQARKMAHGLRPLIFEGAALDVDKVSGVDRRQRLSMKRRFDDIGVDQDVGIDE